jgi:hypothetical protein
MREAGEEIGFREGMRDFGDTLRTAINRGADQTGGGLINTANWLIGNPCRPWGGRTILSPY